MTPECDPLNLDRMAIEEVGANPEKLAGAIHRQLDDRKGSVPLVAIANALDIVEIKVAATSQFEGALLMAPGRNFAGVILNGNSPLPRRRFTLAHELGHFLNVLHRPVEHGVFRCRSSDMGLGSDGLAITDRHRRQEAEANRFAAALLMPDHLVRPCLESPANLDAAVALSDELEVSKEAALRRYVVAHSTPQAVLFGRAGRLLYAVRHEAFPQLGLRAGHQLPHESDSDLVAGTQTADWLAKPERHTLRIARRQQRDDYEIILLVMESQTRARHEPTVEPDEVEDLVDRLDRWSDRAR